jgi:hypothetical protein
LKKAFIIISAFIVLLLGTLFVLPSLFKTKIKKLVDENANSLYNSSIRYRDFNLSFIKSFPEFKATFYNVSLISKEETEKDTLMSTPEISAKIDFLSILKNRIVINEIGINNLEFNLLNEFVKMNLQTVLQADQDKFGFKFNPGQSKLNGLPLLIKGGFSIFSDSMIFNIQFEIPNIRMQQAFSMVPDKYQSFFNGVKPDGNASFGGKIVGLYYKNIFPAIDARLKIKDGVLKYPDLPNELKIDEASATIFKPEGNMDSMMLDIDKLSIQLGENHVNLTTTFKSVMTDPIVDAKLNGKIDVGTLMKIFPIDSVTLKGLITADATFSGKIADAKRNNFDKFVSSGCIKLNDCYLKNRLFPLGVTIIQGTAELKNQNLKIEIGQLLCDQIRITDLSGNIELRNQQFALSDLAMNVLGGTMKIKGTVIANGSQNKDLDLDIDVRGFDLPTAYHDLTIVQKYLPFAEKVEGQFSSLFKLQSKLGAKFKIDPASIKAAGSFSTNNVKIVYYQSLNSLKSVIQISKLKNLKLDNCTVEFNIMDGILHLEPFKTSLAEQPLIIAGNYNLDRTLDFRIDGTLDREILSTDIQNIISYMPGSESIKKVDVSINLFGDLNKPDVKIDTEKIRKQVIDHVKKSSVNDIRNAAKKMLEKFLH